MGVGEPAFCILITLLLWAGSYYNGNNLPYSTPGAYYTPSGCGSGCMTPISTNSYSFQSVSGGEPQNHLG